MKSLTTWKETKLEAKDALSKIKDAKNIVSTKLTQMKSSLQLASRKHELLDN